jgi:modulator of FtsH protease HflK
MAWNEPGGGKDPWGGNRKNDGPPDLDEALNRLKEKFSGFGGGSNSDGGKNLAPVLLAIVIVVWGLLGFYQIDEKEIPSVQVCTGILKLSTRSTLFE